jgi:hypothetical protein
MPDKVPRAKINIGGNHVNQALASFLASRPCDQVTPWCRNSLLFLHRVTLDANIEAESGLTPCLARKLCSPSLLELSLIAQS